MEHKVRTVTRSARCKVDHCSCGAVHIAIGSTTVRVNAEAARELRDVLVRAMAEIDSQPQTVTASAAVLKAPFKLVLPDDDGDDGDDGPQVH